MNVIYFALPYRICQNCGELMANKFLLFLFLNILMPLEVFFNGTNQLAFMGYTGGISYWRALWTWLKGGPNAE